MRRTSLVRAAAAASLTLALAGGLTACAGDSGASTSPTATTTTPAPTVAANHPADVAAVDKITITGDAGKEPTVTLPSKPFAVTTTVVRTVADGTGAAVKDGQLITLHAVVIAGEDGTVANSTYSGSAEPIIVGEESGITEFDEALSSARVGSRIVVAALQGEDTYVYAFEVATAQDLPTRASGTAVAPKDGLPTVKLAEDGKPSLTKPSGTAPTSLVAQPLIKGDGAEVKDGDTVLVKYTGWLWNGTQFDSSWDSGKPFKFVVGQGSVIQGWDKGLAGQTVGSQVLLVVPPDQGYGDTATGSIPAGSTLVFVVDIIAAV